MRPLVALVAFFMIGTENPSIVDVSIQQIESLFFGRLVSSRIISAGQISSFLSSITSPGFEIVSLNF